MATFETASLDDDTNRDWRAFAAELADTLASNETGSEVSISPDFQADDSVERLMLIRSTDHGSIVCASSGLESPPLPWQSSDADGIHILEEDAAWVDRFAATVVTQIRRTWNVPHPSFLSGSQSTADAAADALAGCANTDSDATETELAESVERAVRSVPNADVRASGDGSYSVTVEGRAAYVYVASAEEVRVHVPVVERISGRTRAAEVVADLNRRHPRMKFLLVEDRVHAAVSIDAAPFVHQHAVNAVVRLAAFAASVDGAFADNLGGIVVTARPEPDEDVGAPEDFHDADLDGEVPAQLMTLLEIDAMSGGAIDTEDIVSVCGADRSKIVRYEAFCSEQAESWRDYAREAASRGEPDSAAECEAEAVPWDRIVRALRDALRTVGFFDNA